MKKKKPEKNAGNFLQRLTKGLLFMNLGMLCMLVFSVQLSASPSYAEVKKLNLNVEEATVQEVITEIENQSEFVFFYNHDWLDQSQRKVNLDLENATIHTVLEQLFASQDVTYTVEDRDIVLVLTKIEDTKEEKAEENTPKLQVQQQEIEVSGTVTDAQTGEPLPGVNIVIEGTNIGTTTDQSGNYAIEAPSNATLVFSFVGYQEKSIEVNGRQEIDVALEQAITELEEVVAVGYGTQKKVNITGAVASVEAEELDNINTVNATNLLQGQLSGVITKQTSGKPGADDVSFSIRGYGEPLVLVDGDERDLSTVDPKTIESINVLKDASAAIYGARSGNGVVLVTTKSGEFNKDVQINYDGTYSLQQFTQKPRIISNSGEYIEIWREGEQNLDLTPTYDEAAMEKYYSGEYKSYDWYHRIFREWAPRQNHNLSLSGGSEDVSYYTNVGVSDHGSVIQSGDWFYNRYNLRSNVNANITEHLSSTLNLNYINDHRSEVTTGHRMWDGYYRSQPMAPTSFPDTNLIPSSVVRGTGGRAIGDMHKDISGGQDWWNNKFYGKLELEYDLPFIEGLSTNAGMSYQFNTLRDKTVVTQYEVHKMDPETGEYSLDGRFGGTVRNSMVNLANQEFNRLKPKLEIRYSNEFGAHSLEGLLVGEYIEESTNRFSASTQNLLSKEIQYLFLGDRDYHNVGQSLDEFSRGSVIGRFNYSFQNKYLLEGTFRYDASSYFPPDGRWGFFPSVSGGWRISEEPFLQLSYLDNLKLRVSYSETGYDRNAIPYDYFSGYNIHTNPYIMGSTIYRQIERGSLPNTSMTWEDMTNYNIGLDATLWGGKFGFVLEAFYRKRTNILAQPQEDFPSTFGASLPQQNLNSMEDRGLELELSHNNRIGELNYKITGNLTYAKAKWLHYEEEEYTTEAEKRIFKQSGRWQNRSIGYVSDGLFRSQEEIDNHPIDQDQSNNATLIPGDIKYKDLNGDGVITWQDQKKIGYGTGEPDLNFGLNLSANYKGIGLSILFQGASMYGAELPDIAKDPYQNNPSPLEVHWEERFHTDKNPDGSLPAIRAGKSENNMKFSDFWLINVTYFRLKNVNISYRLPDKLIAPIGIKEFRVYLTGNNLGVIDNLGIWSDSFNPESLLNPRNYPPHRTITMGVDLTF